MTRAPPHNELEETLARIRKLAETPHQEDVANADATLTATLADIENQAKTCTKGSEISALIEQARTAAIDFLSGVSVTDLENPFDLSFMIENPDFDNNVTSGWTSNAGAPGYDAKGAEFFEKTFNYYQTLDNMPSGNYRLRAYAFQRPGKPENIYTPYVNGTIRVSTLLYINNTSTSVKHICDDRQPTALFDDGGWGSDKQLADGTYIPNCMTGAEKYFAKGLYDSSVDATLQQKGGTLRIGIKCNNASTAYWTMFDHFRLHFFGNATTTDGIQDTQLNSDQPYPQARTDIYDLYGRRISGKGSARKPGLYIVNKRKVIER